MSQSNQANQAYRQAANSPAGRQAANAAKSAANDVSDLAGDVSDMAAKQYARAEAYAVDSLDQAGSAIKANPWMAVGIAVGLGFLFGALSGRR